MSARRVEPARQNSWPSATSVKAAKANRNSAQGLSAASLNSASTTAVATAAIAGQSSSRRAASALSRPQASSGPIPVNSTSSTPIGVT